MSDLVPFECLLRAIRHQSHAVGGVDRAPSGQGTHATFRKYIQYLINVVLTSHSQVSFLKAQSLSASIPYWS